MGFLKIKVRLEDSSNVTALLNTREEINVITRKLTKDAGLARKKDSILELVSYTNYN